MKLLLDNIIEVSEKLPQIKKREVKPGDWVFVKTMNSTYRIKADKNKEYIISGGWFEKNGLNNFRTNINGCTWGGSAIKTDVLAACGLSIEFGNRLKTSRIKKIIVLPACCAN